MSNEHLPSVSPGYAFGQLERALRSAASAEDSQVRGRAQAKAARWREVLAGIADGRLEIGSRTPVADTPAWVTLEVVHGGFATGRYLAEAPLREDEAARVALLPPDAPGETDRERLNLWYLTDAGLAELRTALDTGSYRVEVPEDAALMVVAWLLESGHAEAALDLVAELRPLLHRLRMTPLPGRASRQAETLVRLSTVGPVRESLRAATPRPRIAAMLETLRVWHPLYDRLVALWCDTVGGELPRLSETGELQGGRPCQVWPADWAQRRAQWLADYETASARHTLAGGHRHPRSNFARLRGALLACEQDSAGLTGRDVGWIRRALANTISKHGAPGSEQRAALRAAQAVVAARPTHARLAAVLAGRLDRYPEDGGIPSLDPIAVPTGAGEAPGVPAGQAIPAHLLDKAARALEAPVEELVAREVITSGEVLARVLPQLSAQLLAADIADARLAALYARTYTAFRRRRSLLLVDLEHQVRIEELPWVRALEPVRSRSADATRAARRTLAQTTMLALTAFPQALLPNPLVRELGALATQAEIPLPLVEEVAADIFAGRFTDKWRAAATITGHAMANTLYARYYDLPEPRTWPTPSVWARVLGRRTADAFTAACVERAREARPRGVSRPGYVALNGTVLEQSQILTTHNLAVLVDTLRLHDRVRELAPGLADQVLGWVVRRQAMRLDNHHSALQVIKNVAYAWRQAVFFLSFCDERDQQAAVDRLRSLVARAGIEDRFGPAVDGLAHVVAGGRFTASGTVDGGPGRRLLGWTTGRHWCLPLVINRGRAG